MMILQLPPAEQGDKWWGQEKCHMGVLHLMSKLAKCSKCKGLLASRRWPSCPSGQVLHQRKKWATLSRRSLALWIPSL
jgi:hypothetical protein